MKFPCNPVNITMNFHSIFRSHPHLKSDDHRMALEVLPKGAWQQNVGFDMTDRTKRTLGI
jgi:hypothetical protein